MLQVNLPYSQWEYKISCVYKILFADGSFYIGCSKHVRSRASVWESIFRTKKGTAGVTIGTNMLAKIIEGIDATLNVLELCDQSDLKDKEALYLFENRENPLMLSSWDGGAWRPIIQYNYDTKVFVKKHVSISSAARFMNSQIGRIQDVLNGERKSHKGMFFIHEHEYNNHRKVIIKKRYKPAVKKMGRDIVMYDLSGCELKRFDRIVAAAKSVNGNSTSIARCLSGNQNTSAGYIWRYV